MAYTFDTLKKFLYEATTSNYCVPGADCKVLYKGKEVFRYTTGYADKETHLFLPTTMTAVAQALLLT